MTDFHRLIKYNFFTITCTGTGTDVSALETVKPAAPMQNSNLIRHQLELLQHCFPQLSSRTAAASHTLIVQDLGVIDTHQQ